MAQKKKYCILHNKGVAVCQTVQHTPNVEASGSSVAPSNFARMPGWARIYETRLEETWATPRSHSFRIVLTAGTNLSMMSAVLSGTAVPSPRFVSTI